MDKMVQYTPIENHYIQLDIVFATAYGINEAVLFSKLYRLQWQFEGKVDEEGNRWVRLMNDEWMKELPFFSSATIRRTIDQAIKLNLIFSRVFTGRCKWFRCNPAFVSSVLTAQNEQLQLLKTSNRTAQNEQLPISSPISSSPIDKGATPPPPAIIAYRSVAKRYPDKATWSLIELTVGTKQANLDFWEQVVTQYIACGWNKTNVAGMLDFYRQRKIPSTQPINGRNNHNGTSNFGRNNQSGTKPNGRTIPNSCGLGELAIPPTPGEPNPAGA